MMLKVMLPAYVPISEELLKLVESHFTSGKLVCCQDIQELTEPGTKLSDEADSLRNNYGQFYFRVDKND